MTRFGPQILTRLGGRTARAARVAGARLRNEVAAGGFAERAGGNGLVPNAGIAVFFATGPENLYQFEQWRRPLERLAERQPVFMITDRADTGDALLASTALPLAFARGSAALERAGRRAGRPDRALPQSARGELPHVAVSGTGAHSDWARRER